LTITIGDFGIGMTTNEHNNNLGTVAKSDIKATAGAVAAGSGISTTVQFSVGLFSGVLVRSASWAVATATSFRT